MEGMDSRKNGSACLLLSCADWVIHPANIARPAMLRPMETAKGNLFLSGALDFPSVGGNAGIMGAPRRFPSRANHMLAERKMGRKAMPLAIHAIAGKDE